MPKVSRTRKHSRKHSRKSARKTRVRRQRGGVNCGWYFKKTRDYSPCLDGRSPNRCKQDEDGIIYVFSGKSMMAAFDDDEEDVVFYDRNENPCRRFYYYEMADY